MSNIDTTMPFDLTKIRFGIICTSPEDPTKHQVKDILPGVGEVTITRYETGWTYLCDKPRPYMEVITPHGKYNSEKDSYKMQEFFGENWHENLEKVAEYL